MKQQPLIFFAAASSIILCSAWLPSVLAQTRPGALPASLIGEPRDIPTNRRCVVTVDSQALPKPEIAGAANIATGFAAPDTVQGILVQWDGHWLVIRDGTNENWIARDKVMMVHFTE